jgi:hypothetical protein
MRNVRYILFSAVALHFSHTFAAGQDPEVRQLTFWDQVKLGAAYYTNPTAVQDTTLFYGYDPQVLSQDDPQFKLEKTGVVICGTISSGMFKQTPCKTFVSSKESPQPEQGAKVFAISSQPTINGRKPEAVLVKKEPARDHETLIEKLTSTGSPK